MTPKKFFITSGVGMHKERLASLEMALRDAKVGEFNLVKVSSIIPPGCELISREEGLKLLSPGQIVFCVLSENATNEKNRLVVASVGLAMPQDPNLHGYLSEHSSFGQCEEEAGVYAEKLAAYMLATTLGLEFDTDDDFREFWQINGHIVKTAHIAKSAGCPGNGIWTTVVAAVVFAL